MQSTIARFVHLTVIACKIFRTAGCSIRSSNGMFSVEPCVSIEVLERAAARSDSGYTIWLLKGAETVVIIAMYACYNAIDDVDAPLPKVLE